jgi:predicted acyl esterase
MLAFRMSIGTIQSSNRKWPVCGLILAAALIQRATLPVPAHPSTEQLVNQEKLLVAMRDGIMLATDIYSTGEVRRSGPVLLLRTPYNKANFESQARRFAQAGYTVVTQDCRGRYGSGGTFGLYFAD